MSDRKCAAAIALLALIACLRVASTYRVFSPTVDEPDHLAAGFEFLTTRYTIDVSHPPLARALCALPLKLAGYPMFERKPSEVEMGYQLLEYGDRIEKTLARARMPNLIFLVIAIAATALLARRAFSNTIAVIAVAVFTNIPAVLAHAGLITTDMAGVAALATAILALQTRKPILIGLAIAFGVLTKMSFFLFFPACALVLVRKLPRVRDVTIALLVALFAIWGGYKFDVGKPVEIGPLVPFVYGEISPAVQRLAYMTMPAPALPTGLAILAHHNRQGHTAFLLGDVRQHGWWYYFPVVFFFKTPIPLLLLALWGARRRDTLPFTLMALAILAVAMTGSIDIGVRHILAMYVPLSIVAAVALHELRRAIAFTLAGWLIIGVAIAHPDYLGWFNELARHPEQIAVDSNLDWGQDVFRLQRYMRKYDITPLHLAYLTGMHVDGALPVDPDAVTHGWVAIGETPLAISRASGAYRWLDAYKPQTRIGRSMRVYQIP